MKASIFNSTLLCILICSLTTHAQDSLTTKVKTRKFFLETTVGYSSINLDKINRDFEANNLATSETGYKYYSIAFGHHYGKFQYRAEFHKGKVSSTRQLDTIRSSIVGYGYNLAIGYAVIDHLKYRAQTFIGLNNNNFYLQFNDSKNLYINDIAKASALDHRETSSGFHFGGISLDLATQFDYLISRKNKRWGCPQENRAFNIGMRLGYRLPLFSVFDYSYDDPTGPYISLVLGSIRTKKALNWSKKV